MNAAELAAALQHHQNGLVACVGLVVLEFGDDAQARAHELLARMALLAGVGGRNQAVAFHSRFDGPRKSIERYSFELPRPGHFALNPARRARTDVTADASHLLVRRALMSDEFRLHHMAALPTKLHRLHMRHGTIRRLA